MVCFSDSAAADIQEVCKIGKLAMSALKHLDSYMDQMPRVLFIYYGFVAPLTERLQSCAENLRRGFECGIASGDTSFGEINYPVEMSCLKYFINQVGAHFTMIKVSGIQFMILGYHSLLAKICQLF